MPRATSHSSSQSCTAHHLSTLASSNALSLPSLPPLPPDPSNSRRGWRSKLHSAAVGQRAKAGDGQHRAAGMVDAVCDANVAGVLF